MHLKDLENRIHENCGFYQRNPARVLLPGHIVLSSADFAAFAAYVLGGGAHGWGGACPFPEAIKEAINQVRRINTSALTDASLPPVIGAEQEAPQKVANRTLTDEAFYAMFREKFANWKPVASDMAKLPEPIRKFIEALQDKGDPEGRVLTVTALQSEKKELEKTIVGLRQKLFDKEKEIDGLGEYADQLASQTDAAKQAAEQAETKMHETQHELSSVRKQSQEQLERINSLESKVLSQGSEISTLKDSLKSSQETLQIAEDLLKQSEEARERQNARFRGSGEVAETSGEAPAPESTEDSGEPEVPGPGTSASE